ncbi:MAG: translation initiation factor [Puniceicoccaceae bacterium]|nr:MAG: translation initiation factor [Puniceicoccaceae bacterium]
MSRRKNKVPLDGSQSRLENSPFAGLESSMEGMNLKTPAALPAKTPPKSRPKLKSKGRVEVRREKAGRGGKTVTTLKAFPTHVPLETLDSLLLKLKKMCACGGTLKDRAIELQGDVGQQVCEELTRQGYQAVRAGG